MIRASCCRRWRQGHRTIALPESRRALPDRFRGRPVIDAAQLPRGLPGLRRGLPHRRPSTGAGAA